MDSEKSRKSEASGHVKSVPIQNESRPPGHEDERKSKKQIDEMRRDALLLHKHHTLDSQEILDICSQVASNGHKAPSLKPKPLKYELSYGKER
jgi:hypothetical protein